MRVQRLPFSYLEVDQTRNNFFSFGWIAYN